MDVQSIEELAGGVQTSSLAEAAASLDFEGGTGKPPEEEIAALDPRAEEEYTFKFEFTDARGRIYEGEFTNKILSRPDQRRVANLEAQLNGLPANQVPSDLGFLNRMMAWLTISLQKRPQWAKDFDKVLNDDLLRKLYGEVMAHQAYFCGTWDGKSESS